MGKLAMLLLAAIYAATVPARAQETVTLKLSQFLGPTSFFQVDFAVPWARELEARTQGRVKVELFDGSTPFGGVGAQASQVRSGAIDIALGLRGAEGDAFPRTSIIELPFLVRDATTGSRALWTLFQKGAFGPEFSEFKVLALFVQNPGLLHTARKPVTVVDDIKGLRLRAPNQAAAAALTQVGALPVILQVNDVMPAVQSGQIEGIVTNWGNPLPGFNAAMHYHTNVAFYTSVFFVVMNKDRFAHLPPDIQQAIDAQSGVVLVDRFGELWSKWDAPIRDGATGPGQVVITPDAAAMAGWREALKPVTDTYLTELSSHGFPDARGVYDQLRTLLPAN
jgi:TRAP-type C4-dicarboxylate transport system substrate-binding protein